MNQDECLAKIKKHLGKIQENLDAIKDYCYQNIDSSALVVEEDTRELREDISGRLNIIYNTLKGED